MENQFSDIKDLESKIKLSLDRTFTTNRDMLDALLILTDEIKQLKEEIRIIKNPL